MTSITDINTLTPEQIKRRDELADMYRHRTNETEITITGTFKAGYEAGYADAKPKDRCPCGGIILADTEDWSVSLCNSCAAKPLDQITELTRKFQVAKDALESISKNSCCGQCQEAKFVAEKALKELE